jgi:hypothetical protein
MHREGVKGGGGQSVDGGHDGHNGGVRKLAWISTDEDCLRIGWGRRESVGSLSGR